MAGHHFVKGCKHDISCGEHWNIHNIIYIYVPLKKRIHSCIKKSQGVKNSKLDQLRGLNGSKGRQHLPSIHNNYIFGATGTATDSVRPLSIVNIRSQAP